MLVNEKRKKTNPLDSESSSKENATRRKSADRRKSIARITSILDRRSIEDRRKIQDRRVSLKKPSFIPITEFGLTIDHLINEQEKGIKATIKLKDSILSKGHDSELINKISDLYFAINSQLSKEKKLNQWYVESTKNNQDLDDEITQLVSNMHFILSKDLQDIKDIFEKYLTLRVDVYCELDTLQIEMKEVARTLKECLQLKEKYLYPHYREYLAL